MLETEIKLCSLSNITRRNRHLPHFSITYQVPRYPFLNIYQPFSNLGTKTKAIACLTPNVGAKNSATPLALSFQVYKISSYRASKRAGKASCSLATPHHTALMVLFIHQHQHNIIKTCTKLEYGGRTNLGHPNQPSMAMEEGRMPARDQGVPNQATSRIR
jgi:hypothetical protein